MSVVARSAVAAGAGLGEARWRGGGRCGGAVARRRDDLGVEAEPPSAAASRSAVADRAAGELGERRGVVGRRSAGGARGRGRGPSGASGAQAQRRGSASGSWAAGRAGWWQTSRSVARAGRLLQELQQGVGGVGVQLVGGVDDGDAPAAVGGRELEEAP